MLIISINLLLYGKGREIRGIISVILSEVKSKKKKTHDDNGNSIASDFENRTIA